MLLTVRSNKNSSRENRKVTHKGGRQKILAGSYRGNLGEVIYSLDQEGSARRC